MEDNELYHSGVKGQKWGLRRYQNEDGSLTEEGRRHYGYGIKRAIKSIGENHKKKKLAKKRAKALEKARKARAEKKAHNEAKKKAIETGDATEVLKYKNELSTKEKQDIYNRLLADENLARISDNEIRRKAEEAARNSKWNKAKGIVNKLNDAADMLNKATNAYNAGVKVYNAFSDSKLPMIGENASRSAKDKYGESMRMAEELKTQFDDLSLDEIKSETERITAMKSIEKLAAGEDAGGKKKK